MPATSATYGAGSTSRRLPRAERRTQLVRAAAAAFVRAGYDATSMEDVAEAAGVTRLIVYRNFASKEALYRSVLESVTADLRHEFVVPDEPDRLAGFAARGGVAAILVRVARRHPDAFRLLWRHALHEPLFAAEADAFREVVVAEADGLIHPAMDDAELRRWAAASIVSHLFDGVCAWIDHGDPGRDDEFTRLIGAGTRALVAAWAAV